MTSGTLRDRNVVLATLVAALGYFVDIFDLLLFALVRVRSLKDLLGKEIAAAQEDLLSRAKFADAESMERAKAALEADILQRNGILLDNYLQTTGLVLGGLAWGILADRLGRLQMLFGSIVVYSVANILNAFVADVPADGAWAWLHAVGLGTAFNQYALLRFVAGFGLAGELGAGITLVSELVRKEQRGFATTMVATVGIMGAVCAYFVTELVSDWRNAYLIGGMLGLALLFLRVGVVESGMFSRVKQAHGSGRGAFWLLGWPWARARRFLALILLGVPIWYCVGILVKYCDAIGLSMGIAKDQVPKPGLAIMWCYVGLAAGDLASGLLSQLLKSRRRALLAFHVLTAAAIIAYFTVPPTHPGAFYAICVAIGFGCGYWAVFVTTTAEQFGTNLRATATTSAPNFVRGSAAGSAALWHVFERIFQGDPEAGAGAAGEAKWRAAALLGAILVPVAMLAAMSLRESFGSSLDWTEAADGTRTEGPGEGTSARA
ncbi:MAG: MFS transporter [Phycisphaerales bacterium]